MKINLFPVTTVQYIISYEKCFIWYICVKFIAQFTNSMIDEQNDYFKTNTQAFFNIENNRSKLLIGWFYIIEKRY